MNKKRFINVLIDYAFKKVFAGEGEESKFILMDFLNSLLELTGEDKIVEITHLNPFNDREYENDKMSIMDIKVKTQKEERIDIEVQINDVDDYRKRSLYYWSKLYAETIEKGEQYYNLKKSIVISIVDFDLIKESSKYHSTFIIKEKEDNSVFIEDLELHFIELSKFNVSEDIENLNDLEEWILFLKECGSDDKIIEKLCEKKEEIKVATKIVEKLSADELEYQRYLAREKYYHDEMSKKQYAEYKARLATEEGLKKGFQKGLEEGIEKGIEKGIQKGIEQEKLEIAKNLLDILDDEMIALKTGLDISYIEKLRKNE